LVGGDVSVLDSTEQDRNCWAGDQRHAARASTEPKGARRTNSTNQLDDIRA
jgi:hypothetical protein